MHLSNIATEDDCKLLIPEQEQGTVMSGVPVSHASAQFHGLPFAEAVQSAAQENSLEAALIHAVITVESGSNAQATSPRGAQGLMQLMPATARRFKLHNPYDPAQNIRAGASYLRELLDLFKGDVRLTLAAYNAGPNAVLRHGNRIPPYAETQHYVPKVMRIYRGLSQNAMMKIPAGGASTPQGAVVTSY